VLEHINGVVNEESQVAYLRVPRLQQTVSDPRFMDFDTDEIVIGRRRGLLDKRLSVAESDLQDNVGHAAEQRRELERRFAEFDAVGRPKLLESALLGRRHATGATHETANGPFFAVFVGHQDWNVRAYNSIFCSYTKKSRGDIVSKLSKIKGLRHAMAFSASIVAAIVAFSQPGQALAQDGSASALLEDIVTVALKKSDAEAVQDVPLAVTAFGAEQIDALFVKKIEEEDLQEFQNQSVHSGCAR